MNWRGVCLGVLVKMGRWTTYRPPAMPFVYGAGSRRGPVACSLGRRGSVWGEAGRSRGVAGRGGWAMEGGGGPPGGGVEGRRVVRLEEVVVVEGCAWRRRGMWRISRGVLEEVGLWRVPQGHGPDRNGVVRVMSMGMRHVWSDLLIFGSPRGNKKMVRNMPIWRSV